MKKTIFLIALIVITLTQHTYATTQVGDNLTYNGNEYKVWVFTLSDKMGENKAKFFKDPEHSGKGIVTTANWDGVVVDLIIKDNKLYVTKIDLDAWEDVGKPSCEDVFGVTMPEGGLFADWYSGELITEPYSWHMDGSSHTFVIKNGILTELKKGPLQEEK